MEDLKIIISEEGITEDGRKTFLAQCPQMDVTVLADSPKEAEKDLILIVKKNSESLLRDESDLRAKLKPLLPYARYVIECGENFKFTQRIYIPSDLKYF